MIKMDKTHKILLDKKCAIGRFCLFYILLMVKFMKRYIILTKYILSAILIINHY